MRVLNILLLGILVAQICGGCLSWGCDKKNELKRITEESKRWLPYNSGAKLIFESGTSKDTVTVTDYHEEIESFWIGDECPEGKMETIKSKLTSKLFSDTIFFKIEMEDIVLLENSDFFIEYRDSRNYLATANNSKSYNSTLILGRKTFRNVIVSDCSNCNSLKEIVFAKEVGLIAYRIGDNYWIKK